MLLIDQKKWVGENISKEAFDGGKWHPSLKVYHKRNEIGSKAQILIWNSLDDKGLS